MSHYLLPLQENLLNYYFFNFYKVSIAGPIDGVEEARRRIRVSQSRHYPE